jgi:drug/metabolite transporter (DMT)-like permease
MVATSELGRSVETRAAAAAALGSVLVGTVPYFAIGLYQAGMDVASVLVWRYWIALAVLVPMAWWTSPGLRSEWAAAGRGLFLNGMILGVAQTYTYFRAVQTVPSSVVITVFFAYPIVMLALDRWLFAIRVRWPSMMAAGFILAGALLAGWPSLGLGNADPVGILCALATPLIYVAYLGVAYRFTRRGSPFMTASAIYLGMGCGYAALAGLLGIRLPANFGEWQVLVTIALVGGVIQIAALAYALPRLSAGRYSIVVSLELVTVVLIGVLLLGERLTPVQFGGIGLVAVGILADRLMRASGEGLPAVSAS